MADKSWVTERPALVTLTILSLTLCGQFLIKLASQRRRFRRLRAQGLPMPPHSLLFGHLLVLNQALRSLPSDAHATYLPFFIKQSHPDLGPDFYLDLWPFAPSMLVVGSPETLNQATIEHVLEKNHLLKNFLYPLTDGLDMVSSNGHVWKEWRSIFNPGFRASHLIRLTPAIVEEVQVYCEQLDKHVTARDVFPMKPLTDNLILDVVGQLTVGVHFQCQTTFNQAIHSLRTQIKWLTTGSDFNLLNRFNPIRPILHWYHGRLLNQFVMKQLDRRIETWQKEPSDAKHEKDRTIVDLALSAYVESHSNDRGAVNNPFFKQICVSQLKIFLYAGHDTTSSGSCFNLWLLSQNPTVLSRLREEHDRIFGTDPSQAAELLSNNPYLINQLPFTTAVIKESLRLSPPVTSSRGGDSTVHLVDHQNRLLPTEGLVVWLNQQLVHRDPRYWVDPESFLPDRWMLPPDNPLYPVPGMWRPFEHGPRNCLGQELAMLEMKIILVLVSRRYEFEPAYDELDAMTNKQMTTVLGAKAYQVDSFQPRGDLPVRVTHLKGPRGQ